MYTVQKRGGDLLASCAHESMFSASVVCRDRVRVRAYIRIIIAPCAHVCARVCVCVSVRVERVRFDSSTPERADQEHCKSHCCTRRQFANKSHSSSTQRIMHEEHAVVYKQHAMVQWRNGAHASNSPAIVTNSSADDGLKLSSLFLFPYRTVCLFGINRQTDRLRACRQVCTRVVHACS